MMVRTCVAAGTYASLVSLLSLGGFWGLPLAAAPFASVEAPGAQGAVVRQAAPDRQEADGPRLPVRAARIERRDASRGLEGAVAAIATAHRGTAWLAWTVPAVSGHREGTDWRNGDRWRDCDCVLDEDGHIDHGSATSGNTTRLVVLTRLQDGAIDRVTFTDARCTVQAANRTVYWLEGVRPADNVTWAARLIETAAGRDASDRHDGVRSTALALVALTDDASADRVVEDFTASNRPSGLRRDAAFWLGAARGARGAALVDHLARTDRDARFREHLMFVLTLTGDRGIERLLDRARNDESPQVRGQALFWIAQKAGERAVGTLARAVESDPDVEVRQRAVFAISQLPKDEAVPKLIALAESHRDRQVRQQAMFWLGQSGDPRALTFFEQVLRR
jgi:HEAT repeats